MQKMHFLLGAIAASLISGPCHAIPSESVPEMGIFKKKKKAEQQQPASDYKKLVGSDSVNIQGVMNVIKKEQDYYLEMPVKLMGRVFLVSTNFSACLRNPTRPV